MYVRTGGEEGFVNEAKISLQELEGKGFFSKGAYFQEDTVYHKSSNNSNLGTL